LASAATYAVHGARQDPAPFAMPGARRPALDGQCGTRMPSTRPRAGSFREGPRALAWPRATPAGPAVWGVRAPGVRAGAACPV